MNIDRWRKSIREAQIAFGWKNEDLTDDRVDDIISEEARRIRALAYDDVGE